MPSTLKKNTVRLRPAMDAEVKRLAKALMISEAEVIRRAIKSFSLDNKEFESTQVAD